MSQSLKDWAYMSALDIMANANWWFEIYLPIAVLTLGS